MPLNFGHRSYPSGNVFLQFVFGPGRTFETRHAYKPGGKDKVRPNQAIILPKNASWRVKLEASPDFVLVKFKPGMAAPFFNLSLSELDGWEKPTDIWSTSVTEQLCEMEFASIQDRIQIIERVLLHNLERSTIFVDRTVRYAIDLLQRKDGRLKIQNLAERLHISSRQLRRKFQHYVGHTPKQYNNIVRFHSANRLLQQFPEMTLTEVAHRSGYFDLAHFTHSVQEITGISPTQMSRIDQKELEMNKRDIDSIACPVLLAV